ncbi:MAG: molybdopterin-dependent oxidoreductase [Candidatus Aminicenantes bacterium]|nr:molybdopterin-dependent oxidoreductase [Candidatus Aminicenantes bacterium]
MKITIDGKTIELEERKTVLEVARQNGIYIPSLCDHPRLTPFSGCRLCIVQIKGRKGYPPSCSTLVEDSMEVVTKSPGLQKLREEILELILAEHPNACLICSEKEKCDEYKSTIRKVGETTGCVLCPNNGRCELQDVVDALKVDRVRFPSLYRNLEIKKSDPFFDRNYNLCILCGRCVRICQEVRGASTLAFAYRGSQAVVGTVLDKPHLESGCQFCGACVDVCPTGALSERALKYELLPEEKAVTICPLCSMGCELEVQVREGRILSTKPSDQGVVNQGQACVKGRFLIRDIVHSPSRILKPMIRVQKKLEEVSWDQALDFVAQRLKRYKGREVAFVSSSQTSCEDNFLFHKFAREALKTENIWNPAGFSPLSLFSEMVRENGLDSGLNFRISDLSKAKVIFLVGADLPVSHPIIWLELLKAVRAGAKFILVSPIAYALNRYAAKWLQVKPGTEYHLFNCLSKVLLGNEEGEKADIPQGLDALKKTLAEIDLSQSIKITGIEEEELEETTDFLMSAGPAAFLFGMGLAQGQNSSAGLAALWNLARVREAQIFPLGLENNLRGALEAARNSSAKGSAFNLAFHAALPADIKALYLTGPLPGLEKTKLEFLVVQDSFMNENTEKADAVLPATTFAETEGTFINAEGRVLKFVRVIEPQGEAKPDWWIISQLAQKMGKEDFRFKDASAIMKEMSKAIPGFSKMLPASLENDREVFIEEEVKGEKKPVLPLTDPPHAVAGKKYPFLMFLDYSLDYYRNLNLCQEIRGMSLIRDSRWIKISPEDAKKLGLMDGEKLAVDSTAGKVAGLVKISEAVPQGMVVASFLWNEEEDFSREKLFSAQGNPFMSILPVNIKRGM